MSWTYDLRSSLESVAQLLIHGTALAMITWILCITLLKRIRPAFQCAIWTVVLLKFLAPPILPVFFSLSGLLSVIGLYWPSTHQGDGAAVASSGTGHTTAGTVAMGGTPSASPGWNETFALVLAGVYLGLLLILSLRSLLSAFRQHRHLNSLGTVTGDLDRRVTELCKKMSIRRKPALLETSENISPYVTGLLRPKLIVPSDLFGRFDSETRDALIAHELAHIKRGDLVLRTLQNLARLLLFFWPPVLWVSRQVERAAELACDQWAIDTTSVNPRNYASSLLTVVRHIGQPLSPSQNLTFARKGTFLEERFNMILKKRNSISPKMNWLMVPAVLGWAAFALGGATAQSTEQGATEVKERMHIVIQTDDSGEGFKMEASVLPEADIDMDGFITLDELQAYADANPDLMDLEITSGPEGDNVHFWVSRDGSESGMIEMQIQKHHAESGTTVEIEKIIKKFGDEKKVIIVGEAGDYVIHETETEGQPGERTFNIHVEGPDFTQVLKDHPEADLDGDGKLSPEEFHAYAQTSGEERNVFVFRNEESIGPEGGALQVMKITAGSKEEIDTDGDGMISEEEMAAFAETHGLPHPVGEPGSHEGHRKMLFIQKEGSPHSPEHDVVIIRETPEAEEALSQQERSEKFLVDNPEADADGDGVISKQEAEAFAAKLQKSRQVIKEKQEEPK
ncbi:MAG: EF-hand domain-containing protein [Acidobacteriota bacterium]|nr:MAG: EF-hand domain-containing protein [Acidobacteriota bacterium]